ncbi:MAG: DNA polymerase III subunit gamma/tau [Verrucomicrobia bacterium]|nr:DNA polymerase III subunit gamma/tau [Verrucomicrobiota bacterium]
MEQAYQVIARRWRPKQFDELVGQDHIVQTLRNAIESKRIAHAYLFVGPRGTGKTSSARLFAKSLNAEGGPSVAPDNDSEISQAIMNGSCMDVIEIDGASNNSVDQVRELREDCQYAPTQCTYKIYIIDEVHMLSTAAFNALLKTLEEPPSHVIFIFATTESHKVLPTIVSRCQRFEFRPISDEVIVEKLATIGKAEGIKVAPEALAAVARLANGGMRDSQSILDQMISFCGKEIAEQDVLDVYGLVSAERITQLAGALGTLDFAAIIAAVDVFVSEGRDLYRILVDLEAEVRRVLLDAIQNSGSSDKLGVSLTTESLMRMLDALHAGGVGVKRGLSEKVNFEVVLLKAAEESRSRAIDTVLKQLAGSEGGSSDATGDEKKN